MIESPQTDGQPTPLKDRESYLDKQPENKLRPPQNPELCREPVNPKLVFNFEKSFMSTRPPLPVEEIPLVDCPEAYALGRAAIYLVLERYNHAKGIGDLKFAVGKARLRNEKGEEFDMAESFLGDINTIVIAPDYFFDSKLRKTMEQNYCIPHDELLIYRSLSCRPFCYSRCTRI